MADRRIHGVVISASPLEIRAQRLGYRSDERVAGLERGSLVTFVAEGAQARRVRAVTAKKGPRFVHGRHQGIITCASGPAGEYLVWRSIDSLDAYARESGDEIDGEPVELGDHVSFDVMADDGLAWDPTFRGRRPKR